MNGAKTKAITPTGQCRYPIMETAVKKKSNRHKDDAVRRGIYLCGCLSFIRIITSSLQRNEIRFEPVCPLEVKLSAVNTTN